ncbi:MAG: hypothetical protein A2172_05220 [Candidatus Woykebacteria bacterium RBG_13_40_15]|uniref:Peptidase C39-like domain-containing protein n=1 Tax=Candidatus Woykebacteria bacterium RBG_13_40_15 TaxID=1802593 RepID=A0A1G1W659_9BACT|nr:MAG: hypothetical protein A2172_05220 [Candidatus Woykebacteria bacterium RBG_13_40_15]
MLDIPYIKQPDPYSCALASYTTVAKYFFPEATFNQLAKISDWQKGFVVWGFKFWLWVMGRGIKVTKYDTIDYGSWAKDGVEGLKRSVSEKEFNYYVKNTKDIEGYSSDIAKVLNHPNFTLINEKPTFETLERAVSDKKICEVVLDSRTLKGKEGFSLHRVAVLEVDDTEVIFHDPAYEAYSKATKEKFIKSWLEAVPEPALCIYER